jgi:hypothetical protein
VKIWHQKNSAPMDGPGIGGAGIPTCLELESEAILALKLICSGLLGGDEYTSALADPRQARMPAPPSTVENPKDWDILNIESPT